jgi:hypothetical protein
MGFAIAPSTHGSWLRRVGVGALIADASFVIGHRAGGAFDIGALAWAAPLQFLSWVLGTVIGVAGAGAIGDPSRWGLDVLFPVFYLSVLLPELFRADTRGSQDDAPARPHRRSVALRPLGVAGLAGLVTLALTPLAPPGIPILAAAGAALIGLWPPSPGKGVKRCGPGC